MLTGRVERYDGFHLHPELPEHPDPIEHFQTQENAVAVDWVLRDDRMDPEMSDGFRSLEAAVR